MDERSTPTPTRPAQEVEIVVRPSQLEYLAQQMETIIGFFEARDEMNAAVHLEGVKFSPITLVAHDVRTELTSLWQEGVAALAAADA